MECDTLAFGPFILDRGNRRLLKGDEPIDLGSRYFDALSLLATHPDELMSKDRFLDEVWAGVPVTDEALTQCIRTLRRALGDRAGDPQYIQTVPKHGYRFVADVASASPAGDPRSPGSDKTAARLVGATTLGGALSGLAGGAIYGFGATSGESGAVVAVCLLTFALSIIGAAAIGAGMGIAQLLRPANVLIRIAGATMGGALIGAVGQALAASGLEAVTGTATDATTGMAEGAALGFTSAVALAIAQVETSGKAVRSAVALAAGAGIMALLSLGGADSYLDTLRTLENAFPDSRIAASAFIRFAGPHWPAAFEGALFASCIVMANRQWAQKTVRKKRATREGRPTVALPKESV